MQTVREYLFGLGLAKAATGRGRFSREAHEALSRARDGGMTFSDDVKPDAKPKVVRTAAPKVIAVKSTERFDPKAVREWAKANGHTIGERGRIHSDIVNAYLAGTVSEERPEQIGELDVYRDARAHSYPLTTVFVDDAKRKYSARVACTNCRVSLVGCTCGAPSVCTGHGIVRVNVEGG